jgi:xanthine dehydrogenase accessory factor
VTDALLALAAELSRRGERFALATVVRCERPTSAKPGAKALVREDGTVTGWVGGACAEPVVVREAQAAMRDGRPRLIGLVGEGHRGPGRTEGLVEYPMTCHSGGTLEIYVEPYLPKPLLVLVGHGPVVETLASLARAADHTVELRPDVPAGRESTLPTSQASGRQTLVVTSQTSVVVATHGDADEDALAWALGTEAGYVSLVASRRRAGVVLDALKRRGLTAEQVARVKAPAGLDIGAVTPEEIAVSVLAEIVQHRRSEKPVAPVAPRDAVAGIRVATGAVRPAPAEAQEAVDPICGMLVEIATARYRSESAGEVVYFCCRQCKETFDSR